jgi:hypothetical protein
MTIQGEKPIREGGRTHAPEVRPTSGRTAKAGKQSLDSRENRALYVN